MTCPRRLAAFLCLVALWLQAIAPAAALTMPHDAAPFVICGQAKVGAPTERQTPAHHPTCDHCVLCHTSAADIVTDWRPVFTAFDFPIASPLRWALHDAIVLDRRDGETAKPRGPPRLV